MGPPGFVRTGGHVLEWSFCVDLQETVGPKFLNILMMGREEYLRSVYFPPQTNTSSHFITTVQP